MSAGRFDADVAVVGASFAGLACAEAAARRGLRVIVLERKRCAGSGVHTTGLLTRDAFDAVRPPASVVGERLDAVTACAREGRSIRLQRSGAGFTVTDTAGLLRALSRRAEDAGADVRHGVAAELVSSDRGGAVLRAGRDLLRARHVVACDGARSRIARAAGIAAPGRLLVGAERHVELAPGHGLQPDACLVLLDREIAPGYAAWAVRGVHGAWQCGVLGRGRRWRADAALDALLDWLRRSRGAVVRRVTETRGGIVPAGGAVASPWRGCVVAAGDAAGHVSALTAGGIGRAALAGRMVGAGIGEPGDPWRRDLRELGLSCGGWRLRTARALQAAVALGSIGVLAMLRFRPAGIAAAELAFRPSHPPATWTAVRDRGFDVKK